MSLAAWILCFLCSLLLAFNGWLHVSSVSCNSNVILCFSFDYFHCFECLVLDSLFSMTHQRQSYRSLMDFAILHASHLVVHLNICLRFVWWFCFFFKNDRFNQLKIYCMFCRAFFWVHLTIIYYWIYIFVILWVLLISYCPVYLMFEVLVC